MGDGPEEAEEKEEECLQLLGFGWGAGSISGQRISVVTLATGAAVARHREPVALQRVGTCHVALEPKSVNLGWLFSASSSHPPRGPCLFYFSALFILCDHISHFWGLQECSWAQSSLFLGVGPNGLN